MLGFVENRQIDPVAYPLDAFRSDREGGVLHLEEGWDLSVDGNLSVDGLLKSPFLYSNALSTTPHTISDTDRYRFYEITTGGSDFTINLPTVADNPNRMVHIIKVDSGAGKVIIDGEGAETIYNGSDSYLTLELEHQGDGVTLWSDGTQWWRLGGPTWKKFSDPSTGWLASKTSGWTADSFSGGLEVDFSSVVPAGTKAVRVPILTDSVNTAFYWRKSGDSNISNTPNASNEYSHRSDYGSGTYFEGKQHVIWLSSTYKAQFAVANASLDLYVAYPVEYLL